MPDSLNYIIEDWFETITLYDNRAEEMVYSETEDGKELYMQKHKLTQNEVQLEVIVDKEPVEAGIDPYNKLIDRNPDDNVKKVARK